MTSLPMNLYKDCQTVLAKCSEFDNLNSLKSIFVVVELEPFKNDLPEGVSKQDRVSKTIDHLLNAASKATESVLLIFLEVLISRRSEGDQLREDLRNLKRNIASWFAKYVEIEIPVVSFAMTQDEAEEIINEKVFSNPSVAPVALSKFHELCKSLKEYGITDLRMLYGKRREDWKIEYRESNNTVENVVINTMNCINNKYRIPGGLTLIRPKFESIDFLDPPKRDETESRLRRSGCMAMIIISAGRGAIHRAPGTR